MRDDCDSAIHNHHRGTFAGLALILAVVGTFGVMTYVVGGRVRELGMRMGFGATPGRIVALIVGQAAPVVLSAAALGVHFLQHVDD